MLAYFRRYEIWVFLVLMFVANAVFVSAIAHGSLSKGFYNYGRFALLGAVFFGVIFCSRGMEGVRDALRPMLEWRRSPPWYLFALGWSSLICIGFLSLKSMLTGGDAIEVNFSVVSRPSVLATVLVGSFIGEIVWISYAVRRLSHIFTTYISAMIVGLAWTAWWAPMVFYNVGIVPDLPLAALLINQTGVAAMCAFIYMRSKSGVLVLCMQVMFNLAILVFPVTPTAGGTATYWAFACTYFISALLLFRLFGPRPLLRK
ncbi:hypothetical protein ACEWPL_003200 [Roseovarius sp. S1116L3]|uniref:hypothetical protein n=1 Tax=Roseovarius roseus TaxID=3342636 RepID=UPI00372C3E18